jgi:glycine reductase
VAGQTAAGTRADLERVAQLAAKLRRGEPLGPADVDAYLPTGKRVNEFDERPGAERMVDMLLRKLRRQPFTSEVVVPRFDRIAPAAPIRDLADVLLGIVTTSGIVRQGNPEGMESWRATKWVRYSLAGLERLSPEDFTCVHGGYDNRHVRTDPDRAVPLDVLRDWEKRGKIGRLHPVLYSIVGNVMPVEWARQRGREVAQELRQAGVQAAILTAT